MKTLVAIMLLLASSTSASQTASYAPREANGLPGQAAVEEALSKRCRGGSAAIRNVVCQGYDEEPTEFSCDFEWRDDDSQWAAAGTAIAIDGRYGWVEIGGNEFCATTPTDTTE